MSLLKNMPTYQGQLKKRPLELHITSFLFWANTLKYNSETEKKLYFRTSLQSSDAERFWDLNSNIITSRNYSLEEAIEEFMKQAPIEDDEITLAEFLQLKQTKDEKPSSFLLRAQEAGKKFWTTTNEQELVRILTGNLIPAVREYIHVNGIPKSIKTLRASIKKYEDEIEPVDQTKPSTSNMEKMLDMMNTHIAALVHNIKGDPASASNNPYLGFRYKPPDLNNH